MMGGPSLGLLRLGRRLAGGRLQPVVRMGARGLRIYPSEEGAETVNWDPLHNDSSQLHLDVSVRLLRDLPTALRLLRSFHTTGIYVSVGSRGFLDTSGVLHLDTMGCSSIVEHIHYTSTKRTLLYKQAHLHIWICTGIPLSFAAAKGPRY